MVLMMRHLILVDSISLASWFYIGLLEEMFLF